jgi:amidohydrolase
MTLEKFFSGRPVKRWRVHKMRCVLAGAVFALALHAQDTPTEKEAARDVVRKMADLEKSLNVPGWIARFSAPNAARDQVVARTKQLMDTELLALSDDITKHPEIGFEEHRSIKLLIDCLKRHNFEITEGVANLKTAFVGRYKGNHGAPNLGVILEYDALRGTKGAFHGDQHSAQGPIGIAAAVAIAEYLERAKLPGSVVVFGTPGEEMMPPSAKTEMFKAGVFTGMDIIVRSHAVNATSRPAPGFGTCCLNIDGVKYTFSGAPAHQMTPWNGRNALEAVIHLFNNIDAVRASMRPEARVQGVITEGGAAPNVVPDRAAADFYIRYPDEVYLQQVREFVDNAARAAALATGTKVKIDHYGTARDGISVATLAEVGLMHSKQFGATNVLEAPGKPQGFEETGSVSSAIPGLGIAVQTSTAPNHTYEMEADALAEIGHHGFVVGAQSMAALLFDFATEGEFRTAVKREFTGIQSLFGEYQTALKKVYTTPAVPLP